MSVCVIGIDTSGTLLERNVLKKYLLKHFDKVDVFDPKKPETFDTETKYVAKFILEHITPEILKIKGYSVYVPYHELLKEWDMELLNKMDMVMCKTREARNLLKHKHNNVVYSSFDTPCSIGKSKRNDDIWIHFASSYMKGTYRLLKYWIQNDGFLHVNKNLKLIISMNNTGAFKNTIENKYWKSLNPIKTTLNDTVFEKYLNIYKTNRLNDEDYEYYMKTASVYLQPSVNEGFGHILNEARCGKALLVTTNAPPMSEFAPDELLIDYDTTIPMYKFNKKAIGFRYAYKSNVKTYLIGRDSFKHTITRVLKLKDEEKIKYIDELHRRFLDERKHFYNTLDRLMSKLKTEQTLNGGSYLSPKEEKNTAQFAYVTLIFNGDRYVPGVINLWYSLKKTKTKHDFVCMYTNDVPNSSIELMNKLSIKTRLVDYVRFKTKPSITKKQRERYSKWADVSYTKWQCLNLTEYEKVLFLDSDMVAINNPDDVFKIKTPAGVFKTPWTFHDFYKFKTPNVVTKNEIYTSMNNRGFLATATCMLLAPCEKCFKEFIGMMRGLEPFGFNCMSFFDDQSIAYYYSIWDKGPKVDWRHLGIEYAYLLWKYNEGEDPKNIDTSNIKIIDYFGKDKPWELKPNTWPDLKYWWDIWQLLEQEYPEVSKLINV